MNFSLPPEITVQKQRLEGHWTYTFRHNTLGELGRIILQDFPGGQCHIASEVAGDPNDPLTEKRLDIFRPVSERVTQALESVLGPGHQEDLVRPNPTRPKPPAAVRRRSSGSLGE